MRLSEVSITRPVTTLMVYVAVLILGYISFGKLRVNFLPEIQTPRLTIQTKYKDASPSDIMRLVTEPVEQTLGTISGVKKIRSVSREGISLVQADFYWGTDMNFALIESREKLDRLKSALPKETERPNILRIDPSSEPIMTLVITSKPHEKKNAVRPVGNEPDSRAAYYELLNATELCKNLIKPRLEQLDGVAQVSIIGAPVRELRAAIDQTALYASGLSLNDVSQKLASQNIAIPAGTIKEGNFRYALRAEGEFKTVRDIENAFIGKTKDERVLLFRDVAQVDESFAERDAISLYNAEETIELQIRKEASASTVEVAKIIRAVLGEIKPDIGSFTVSVAYDQSEFIQQSIDDLVGSIYIGAVLAFLVLFFFLNELRYSLIVAVATPLSIVMTFIFMYAFSVSINIISLTGIALGVGMLGDNAIIVVENVSRLRDEGMNRYKAILEGTKEINLAASASTFTNVAIFLPVIFTDGIAREIFRDMGLSMTFSLLSSLIIAVTLVPMLLNVKLFSNAEEKHADKKDTSFRVPFADFFLQKRLVWQARFTKRYEVWLVWILDNRKTVLVSSVIVFLLSLSAAPLLKVETIPRIQQNRFSVTLKFPKGYSAAATADATRQLSRALKDLAFVQGILASVGRSAETSAVFALENTRDADVAELDIDLASGTDERKAIDAIRQLLDTHQETPFQYAVQRKRTTLEQIFRPEKDDIKLKIISQDLSDASRAAEAVKVVVSQIEGVGDLRTGLEQTKPELVLLPNRDALFRYGIDSKTLLNFIEYSAKGSVATEVRNGTEKIALRLRSHESQLSLEQLLEQRIKTPVGFIAVRQLVTQRTNVGYAEIFRENGKKQIVMLANAKEGFSATALGEAIQKKVREASVLPEGVRLEIGGENEEIKDSFKSLGVIILLSLALVFMILAAEFESIVYPLVIMLTSPLALVGAILGMLVMGQTWNAMSLIGVIIMVGAVDNDAVIAADFIIELRRQGLSLKDAIFTGISKRLRSIIMTTLTTVIGIVPLVFSIGSGSELGTALTVPIVFGLLSATAFTLITIPVVYYYLDRENTSLH
jgi:hydrophobic/amphiphilic exporter-1 (mainly G- bacteria), HAE1 family